MLARLLQSLSSDTNDDEGVAELVVTAIGTGGSHYICWKTKSGRYKQQSHGLPRQLEEWLFPEDGSTRDFETLQVILSGEDKFRASDKDGEVRSDGPESHRHHLRRALTFSVEHLSTADKRRMTRAPESPREGERPRSSTLPTVLPREGSPTRPLSMRVNTSNHGRSPPGDAILRRPGAIPINVHPRPRRLSATTRPRSFVFTAQNDLEVVQEQPGPQAFGASSSTFSDPKGIVGDQSNDGCHVYSKAQKPVTPPPKPRAMYADASVQTEADLDYAEPFGSMSRSRSRRLRRHGYRNSSDTSAGSHTSDSYCSDSRRTSLETTLTQPDIECFAEASWQRCPAPNPIMMGRMQDYFRSSTYVLGEALHPSGMG